MSALFERYRPRSWDEVIGQSKVVGVLRRLFVFSDDGEDRVLVNPVVTKVSGDPELDDEGCLSLGTVRVPVERQLQVTIEGKDATGADVRLELEGMSARIVQHELDHLDGVLIIDRMTQLSRLKSRMSVRKLERNARL